MNAQVTGRGLRKALWLLALGALLSGAMAVATIRETPVAPKRGQPGCEPAGSARLAAGLTGPRQPNVECPESLPQPKATANDR